MTIDDVSVVGVASAQAAVVVGNKEKGNLLGGPDWKTNTINFMAGQNNLPLEFRGLSGQMLIDTIMLIESPEDRYYLPEESLSKLAGDSSEGQWTLELWDTRVGASNGPPKVISWELRFAYETVRQTPILIEPGIAITNTIPAGQMLYLAIDVPEWAVLAANSLLFSTPDPVITYFNQNDLPGFGGTNNGDFLMIPLSTQGGFTLELAGTPPLVPNERYFVGLENPGANDVTIGYQVDFNLIDLTNGIPYLKTSSGLSFVKDYYRFQVVDPVQRLQFEVLQPTVDMTLVVRKDLPLPTFALYDYLSANPGTNEEYILVLPDSVPVAVSAGDWFLTAYNLSGMVGDYQIKATQWDVTGQPIIITDERIDSGEFCFSWNSLIGGKYVVQGKQTLGDPEWVDISATIEATATVTDYCVPLPTPFQFFRVAEGVALDEGSTAQIAILRISQTPDGVLIEWLAPPIFQFDVEYSDVFPPVWNLVPGGPITSTDGNFVFLDDGSLTGGLAPLRYYRLVLLPQP